MTRVRARQTTLSMRRTPAPTSMPDRTVGCVVWPPEATTDQLSPAGVTTVRLLVEDMTPDCSMAVVQSQPYAEDYLIGSDGHETAAAAHQHFSTAGVRIVINRLLGVRFGHVGQQPLTVEHLTADGQRLYWNTVYSAIGGRAWLVTHANVQPAVIGRVLAECRRHGYA